MISRLFFRYSAINAYKEGFKEDISIFAKILRYILMSSGEGCSTLVTNTSSRMQVKKKQGPDYVFGCKRMPIVLPKKEIILFYKLTLDQNTFTYWNWKLKENLVVKAF